MVCLAWGGTTNTEDHNGCNVLSFKKNCDSNLIKNEIKFNNISFCSGQDTPIILASMTQINRTPPPKPKKKKRFCWLIITSTTKFNDGWFLLEDKDVYYALQIGLAVSTSTNMWGQLVWSGSSQA